jgi:hypothetical protein
LIDAVGSSNKSVKWQNDQVPISTTHTHTHRVVLKILKKEKDTQIEKTIVHSSNQKLRPGNRCVSYPETNVLTGKRMEEI